MVVIETKNSIKYCAHNGRRFNIIITYKQYEFKASKPLQGFEWNSSEEPPKDFIKWFKNSELQQLYAFINRQRTEN